VILTSDPESGIEGKALPWILRFVSSGRCSHLPDLVIPISVISNKSLSIAAKTPLADTQEISCSLLLPPQIMATLVFPI
jgi:hypothetical protein